VVSVENLLKTFIVKEAVVGAVDNVSFKVDEGAFFTLLGPSGCGKTTILRCLAGLERPEKGRIQIGQKEVFASERKLYVQTSQRDIGMVFQSYAIWPHMSVFQNVAYPLRFKKMSSAEMNKRVSGTLAVVGLAELGDRQATRLSGGQQQRVALARALVAEPQLLLLDEPLSNLDAKLRGQMRVELKRLQLQLGKTAIYVTHDQQEALTMSDILAVMNKGKIIQVGTPEMVYSRPINRFVAEFIGASNIFSGRVTDPGKKGIVAVATADGPILGTLDPETKLDNKQVVISIRPERIFIKPLEERQETNCMQGQVEHLAFQGDNIEYQLRVGENLIMVIDAQDSRFPVGSRVNVTAAPEHCWILPDDKN